MGLESIIPAAITWPIFRRGLENPEFFREILRPIAYAYSRGDPEKVHEMSLDALNKHSKYLDRISGNFDFPSLHVEVCGKEVMPFWLAEGADKNLKALYPLSKILGGIFGGTVVVPFRKGNDFPRVATDDREQNGYNAQGFPSEGLSVAEKNLKEYRILGGKKPVITSVCGIPPSSKRISVAYQELGQLSATLTPYSNGFVWNPFSPNTEAIRHLRTPEVFGESARILRNNIGNKLLLVKMGPYEDNSEARREWLSLVNGFIDGGGDGIVAVNTYMIPRAKVPSTNWGYDSAGVSGRFLQPYRQRAITDFRNKFGNEYFMAAEGGVDNAEQAFMAFKAGANIVAGYTPYIFNGFGLVHEMARGLEQQLQKEGFDTLKDFQESIGLAA